MDARRRDVNDEVKGKLWFDVQTYPTASFVSTGLAALGGNRYQATGKLTIKGTSRVVVVPFTATPVASQLTLEGDIPVSRAQYGLGAGMWADPSVVADAVQVRFTCSSLLGDSTLFIFCFFNLRSMKRNTR